MNKFSEIIPQEEMKRAHKEWLGGLGEEIEFWNEVISTGGGDWAADFEFRLSAKNQDVNALNTFRGMWDFVRECPEQGVKVLDVGSGPLTILGHKGGPSGKKIHLTACDPLANAYNALLDKHNIDPPTKTIFADGENLAEFFEANSFDAVCMRNALDHSYNPMLIILQMMRVIKVGGAIFLSHFENEAENENYIGLHQWNITNEEQDMIIWNKNYRFSIAELLAGYASVSVSRSETDEGQGKQPWIWVQIEKIKELDFDVSAIAGNDLHLKYQLTLDSIIQRELAQVNEPAEQHQVEQAEQSAQADTAHLEKELKRKIRGIKNLVLVLGAMVLGALLLLAVA